MPYLPNLGHVFGSADLALLDRRTFVLPCSICSAPGPHAHRLEREHGIVALCDVCDTEVREYAAEHVGEPLHGRSIAPSGAASESIGRSSLTS